MFSLILKLKVAVIMVGVPVFSMAAVGAVTYRILPPPPPELGDHKTDSGVPSLKEVWDNVKAIAPSSSSGSSVPEPSGLAPLALGCGLLVRRRRSSK
jgi:hypothetical protein